MKLQCVKVYCAVLFEELLRNVPGLDVSQEEKDVVLVYSDVEISQSWLECANRRKKARL